MEDLSLHLLDIAENSIDAGATRIDFTITENSDKDLLTFSISDNGRGMDAETLEKVSDPFFSTKTVRRKRFGLGIPLLKQAAEECSGSFSIESSPGNGTVTTAIFQRSHIDRKPLGNIGSSVVVLISGHPDIDFTLSYVRDSFSYRFDSASVREALDGVPINLPDVLILIKSDINEAIHGDAEYGT
ncbi:MAG: ATP-binding protein [Nitrospirae bacterium]|nr:ATP-binding protein [Nitrospirota bacterium]